MLPAMLLVVTMLQCCNEIKFKLQIPNICFNSFPPLILFSCMSIFMFFKMVKPASLHLIFHQIFTLVAYLFHSNNEFYSVKQIRITYTSSMSRFHKTKTPKLYIKMPKYFGVFIVQFHKSLNAKIFTT